MECTRPQVAQHFPSSLGVDDFIARMEIALHAYGFQDSNTIACSNLCRDEVTFILKQKLDAVRLLELCLDLASLHASFTKAAIFSFKFLQIPKLFRALHLCMSH